MICSRVQNLLSAYVDRELTGEEMLHVRSHLATCPDCDHEHAQIRRMKSLLGSLDSVEPTIPFNGGMLQAPPRRSRAWLRLRYYAFSLREAVLTALAPPSLASPQGEPDGRILPPVALGGALAVGLLLFAILQQPQSPDAVAAHVPEAVPADPPVYPYSGPFLRVASDPQGYAAGVVLVSPSRRGFSAPVHYTGPDQRYVVPLTYSGPSQSWHSVDSR